MSFDLSAITLKVETKQLDEAIEKLNKLQQATSKVEQEVKKQGKASKDSSEEQGKSATKAEKLVDKLKQTYEDLSNEFTRGESAVLRYARSLGVSGQQMQVIIGYLQNIKKLSKDPFDDSIGSVRRIQREYEELTNRTNLLAKGIALTAKQAREYSKLSDEIAGKMQAQKLDPVGKDAAVYSERLAKAQEEYLSYVKRVSDLKKQESPVVQSRSTVTTTSPAMDMHVLMYRKQQVELEKLNSAMDSHVAKFYKAEQSKANTVKTVTEQAASDYDQHVKMYVANMNKLEARESKSFNTRLENLRKFNQRTEDSLKQADLTGITSAPMARAQGVKSALTRMGVASEADLIGNPQALQEITRAGNNAAKAWEVANRQIKSSREMAFAMRQVPMQITDIVVSLAGGQSPFQVLLQQGGQLKDLFGGVKEAAVALGKGLVDSLVSGFKLLVSPIGLAVAGITLFGSAIWAALDRIENFNKQIILMGSTARVALSDVKDSSKELADSTSTTASKAGAAFIELSKAAQMTGQPLKDITAAALSLEKYGGQSISETAKEIAKLREDPLEAMIALNKETGFLNTILVEQANAFIASGEKSKAAALLIKEYVKQQEEMAKKLKENKGELSTLFTTVSDAAKSTFEKIGDLSLGVIDRMAAPLNELLGAIGKVDKVLAKNPSWASGGTLSLAQSAMAQEGKRATNLQNIIDFANKHNEKSKLNKTRAEVDAWIASLSEEDRRRNAAFISAAKASPEYSGISKGDANKAETERKRLAALAENYNLQGSTLSNYNADYNKKLKDINDLFKSGAITGAAYAMALDELDKSQGWYKQLKAAEKQQKEAEKINLTIEEHINLQKMQIEGQTKGLALNEEERLVKEQLLKLEENRLKVLNDIETNATITEEQRAAQRAAATKRFDSARSEIEQSTRSMYEQTHSFSAGWDKAFASYTDAAKNAAAFGEQAFSKMADGMTDALMQFVTTGKLSFSNLTQSILTDILRIQLRMQVTQLMGNSSGGGLGGLAGMLGGVFGGSSGGFASSAFSNLGSGLSLSSFPTGGGLAFANGGAFSQQGLHAFANGGVFTNSIVNSPTLFKFANGGKFGLMGEAGPEAVMPLSRDSSGRLGVVANGGSSSGVQVVINNMGTSSTVTEQKETVDSRGNRRIELTIADAVASEQARPGSKLYNSTRNSFGLKPALVGR